MSHTMKKVILFLLASGLIESVSFAQTEKNVCGNEAAWQQAIQIDPSLVLRRQQAELKIDQYLQNTQSLRTTTDDDAIRIVPVVFHIIEEGGPENISDAQVVDAMRVFNEDYRRTNTDANQTPDAFLP